MPDRDAGIVKRYVLIGVAFGLAVVAVCQTAQLWGQGFGLFSVPLNQQTSVGVTADSDEVDSVNPPFEVLADRSLLRYEHFPRILTPAETGTIRVVVEAVGDLDALTFRRNLPSDVNGYREEVWPRSDIAAVNGRVISVFEKRYPAQVLGELLVYPHGHDNPQVPLGQVVFSDPEGQSETKATLWLRLAHSGLPTSTVQAIVSDAGQPVAQYASHVANVVLKGFGDRRLRVPGQSFELEQTAKVFYRYFADNYHSLAVIPRRSPTLPDGGLNRNVKNDVQGIGIRLFDDQMVYGSSSLQSIQLFPAGFIGHHATTVHQLGHHWGDETGLAALAGVSASGSEPRSHTPLLFPGEALLGEVLGASRAIEKVDSVEPGETASYRIVESLPPFGFHPLQLYRMGLLEPESVPDVTVFVNQAQFVPRSAPAIGTKVVGEGRTLTINDIRAELGVLKGTKFSAWRQAFVVVSEELVSQREMDYFNFFARRAEANHGTRSFDGYGSFFEATRGMMSLSTDMVPLDITGGVRSSESMTVTYPPFGQRDWRGLVFDTAVPSRVEAGELLRLTGRIDPEVLGADYRFLVFRATPYGSPPGVAVVLQTTISGGRFSVTLGFSEEQVGSYAIDAFVFVDAEGGPISTSTLTPFFVE